MQSRLGIGTAATTATRNRWLVPTIVAGIMICGSLPAIRLDIPRQVVARKYSNAASRFISLEGGVVVHYRDQGVRDAPILLLLHGSNSSLHTWEPWVARLGQHFRTITVDLPGHGLTGANRSGNYGREEMVGFVHEFLRTLGVQRFALAGNSMGGGIAAEYAEQYPGEISALILIDSLGIPLNRQRNLPLGFRIIRTPIIRQITRYVTPRFLIADSVRHMFVDKALVSDRMIDRYYELLLCDGNRKATIARFSAVSNDTQVEAKLSTIKAPTLILWGEEDSLVPVVYGHEFQTRIQGAKLIVYPNVGHIPMEEIPTRSAEDVTLFLSTVFASGRTR